CSLIAVRIVQGIGIGFASTATGTIVSQLIPQSRNGEGISYFSISIVLSAAIGPLIGIELVQTLGYTSIFIFSTIIGLLSLVFALKKAVNLYSINYLRKMLFPFQSYYLLLLWAMQGYFLSLHRMQKKLVWQK